MVRSLLTAFLVVSPALLQAGPPAGGDDRPKITVSGEAVVQTRPDRIVVRVAIETLDQEVVAAKQRNGETTKKVLAVARECGVPDKEMQTDFLFLEQRWDDWYKRQKFLGYVVRNQIVITLNDASRLEELIEKVLAAGAVSIQGIDFQTSEYRKHREHAREMALKAAREKAEKMAAVLGQTVGAPILISESLAGSPMSFFSNWGGSGRSQAMSQNVAQNVSGGEAAGEGNESVAVGKISIRAAVFVTFELKR